jgi:hypothetical protein
MTRDTWLIRISLAWLALVACGSVYLFVKTLWG